MVAGVARCCVHRCGASARPRSAVLSGSIQTRKAETRSGRREACYPDIVRVPADSSPEHCPLRIAPVRLLSKLESPTSQHCPLSMSKNHRPLGSEHQLAGEPQSVRVGHSTATNSKSPPQRPCLFVWWGEDQVESGGRGQYITGHNRTGFVYYQGPEALH